MFNVMETISKLARKKKNVPFDPNGLAVDILADVIHIFTPQRGYAVDPYSASMSAAIAAVK